MPPSLPIHLSFPLEEQDDHDQESKSLGAIVRVAAFCGDKIASLPRLER